MALIVYIITAVIVLFVNNSIFNPVTYLIWVMLGCLVYSSSRILSILSYIFPIISIYENENRINYFTNNLMPSIVIGSAGGIIAGVFRVFCSKLSIHFLNPGVDYYLHFINNINNFHSLLFCLPLFILMNFISSLFYNLFLQNELDRYVHWIFSIVIMSLFFAAIHYVTPIPNDLNYGFVAFEGGIIHGILFKKLKNIFAPTLFLGIQLWVVFVLLWIKF